MAGKFNKQRFAGVGAGLLNEASKKQQTVRSDDMQVVYKSLNELVPHELNQYSQEELMDRVESIRTAGRLLQPILYLNDPLPDGTYKIISGHTRHEALKILATEDLKWAENIPCSPVTTSTVTLPISEKSKEEYLINAANDYRTKTDADRMYEYRFKKKIYQEAKENGYKLTDKMRNVLARDLQISPAQVGKIDYIESHATPEVKEALDKNMISITQADKIAHMKENEQEEVMASFINPPNDCEDGEDQQESTAAPTNLGKKEANKIIGQNVADTLTENSYSLESDELLQVFIKFKPLTERVQQEIIILDKKDYAKYLAAREKIEKELNKIEKLFNNA